MTTYGTQPERPAVRADADEIRRAVHLLWEPGTVAELRCPKTPKGVVRGYFNDPGALIQAAADWSGGFAYRRAETVYITLNPVLPDLLARACNRVEEWAKLTTTDAQILRRRWFLIDLDATRPAGISATDREHEAAIDRAAECREFLSRKLGWPEPIFADSGNGAHLLYRIEAPNTDPVTQSLKTCLDVLARRFDDEAVTVDPTTFNASRISKLYGTLAAKGDSVPAIGRVHRIARILHAPEVFQPIPFDGDTL